MLAKAARTAARISTKSQRQASKRKEIRRLAKAARTKAAEVIEELDRAKTVKVRLHNEIARISRKEVKQKEVQAKRDLKAVERFKRLHGRAQRGHMWCQYSIGGFYATGCGVEQNHLSAFRWLLASAKKGNADAMFKVAHRYRIGLGVVLNAIKAASWYVKAAAKYSAKAFKGEAGGQFMSAHLCHHGLGVARNKLEAAGWYKKAAEQGDARASAILGRMYQNGEGVEQSDVEAASWYLKAEQLGPEPRLTAYGRCDSVIEEPDPQSNACPPAAINPDPQLVITITLATPSASAGAQQVATPSFHDETQTAKI